MHDNDFERYLKTTLGVSSRRNAVRELADRIAPGNRAKLCRRLHAFVETGSGSPTLSEAVREVLGDVGEDFDTALAQTRLRIRARQDSERIINRIGRQAGLGVHIWVEHERRRPSQITIVALTGLNRWKRILLPESLPERNREGQIAVVSESCRAWLKDRGGRCPLFGTVTGFVYRPKPWSSYRFSIDGRLCSSDLGAWQEPIACWSIC